MMNNYKHFTLATILIIIIAASVILSSAVAYCGRASPQTNQEILSLYIKHHNYTLSPDTRSLIASEVITQSSDAGIPWEIIAAIMCIESSYDPNAVGPMGEIGLMQIYTMKCNGSALHKPSLHIIEYNINAGICILLEKLTMTDGDLLLAIERYNGRGPGAREFRRKVIRTVMDIFRFRVAHQGNTRRRRLTSAGDL